MKKRKLKKLLRESCENNLWLKKQLEEADLASQKLARQRDDAFRDVAEEREKYKALEGYVAQSRMRLGAAFGVPDKERNLGWLVDAAANLVEKLSVVPLDPGNAAALDAVMAHARRDATKQVEGDVDPLRDVRPRGVFLSGLDGPVLAKEGGEVGVFAGYRLRDSSAPTPIADEIAVDLPAAILTAERTVTLQTKLGLPGSEAINGGYEVEDAPGPEVVPSGGCAPEDVVFVDQNDGRETFVTFTADTVGPAAERTPPDPSTWSVPAEYRVDRRGPNGGVLRVFKRLDPGVDSEVLAIADFVPTAGFDQDVFRPGGAVPEDTVFVDPSDGRETFATFTPYGVDAHPAPVAEGKLPGAASSWVLDAEYHDKLRGPRGGTLRLFKRVPGHEEKNEKLALSVVVELFSYVHGGPWRAPVLSVAKSGDHELAFMDEDGQPRAALRASSRRECFRLMALSLAVEAAKLGFTFEEPLRAALIEIGASKYKKLDGEFDYVWMAGGSRS